VLFIKAIDEDENKACGQAGLCELCARGIYRATSPDLLTWTAPQPVVAQSSLPEAYTSPDGKVWLTWQDFAATCAAQDLTVAARAPISAAYEEADGKLSTTAAVSFPGETFQTDTKQHFPTNGNPISLPDADARTAFLACHGK
jgi:hypothetical protein